MMRRVTTAMAVAGLLSLGAGTDALAQKANPCGAKNPCAAKASKDAATESATGKSDAARATELWRAREGRTGFAASGARVASPPPIDPIQAP